LSLSFPFFLSRLLFLEMERFLFPHAGNAARLTCRVVPLPPPFYLFSDLALCSAVFFPQEDKIALSFPHSHLFDRVVSCPFNPNSSQPPFFFPDAASRTVISPFPSSSPQARNRLFLVRRVIGRFSMDQLSRSTRPFPFNGSSTTFFFPFFPPPFQAIGFFSLQVALGLFVFFFFSVLFWFLAPFLDMRFQ